MTPAQGTGRNTGRKEDPAEGLTLIGFLKRLRGDRRGVSAVEFALLAPLMIAFYFGLAEFCQGYMSQKRASHSASVMADLAAQATVLNRDDVDDVLATGGLIMRPFPIDALTARVSSVTRDSSGVARIDWSRGSRVGPRPRGSAITIPDDLIANGESLIVSETTYDYASPVKYIMPGVTRFSSAFYLRPRRVEMVACTNC